MTRYADLVNEAKELLLGNDMTQTQLLVTPAEWALLDGLREGLQNQKIVRACKIMFDESRTVRYFCKKMLRKVRNLVIR